MIGAVVATAILTGCSPSQPPATYSHYQYTCCDAADVQRVWHPGETLTMHWSPQSAQTTDSSTQMLTLTASLTGPYADVDSLKKGGAASISLKAAPVSASNGTHSSPVSVIALPAGLAPGLYNLTGTVASSGASSSGSSIIQVAAAGT